MKKHPYSLRNLTLKIDEKTRNALRVVANANGEFLSTTIRNGMHNEIKKLYPKFDELPTLGCNVALMSGANAKVIKIELPLVRCKLNDGRIVNLTISDVIVI